jgi:predicted nucleic acid-binding protein
MDQLVATLDTCVLIPSRLRDTLLDAADDGLYQCRWSDDILHELRRNLIEEHVNPEGAARLIASMNEHFPEALVTRRAYGKLIDAMTNHPKDRHVLAAAVASDSTIIITDNTRDFPHTALAPHGIAVRTADQFLVELFSVAPDRMRRLIRRQAAGYAMPAMTVGELLQRLQKSVPDFARLIAESSQQNEQER